MKTLKAYVINKMDDCRIKGSLIPHTVQIRDGKKLKWIRSTKRVIEILWRGRVLQILGGDWDISRNHVAWDVCCGEIVFLELGFDL